MLLARGLLPPGVAARAAFAAAAAESAVVMVVLISSWLRVPLGRTVVTIDIAEPVRALGRRL